MDFFNKIYKKRLLDEKNIRFPEDIDGGEDSVFLLNYLANSEGIIYVNRPVILYNNTENSLSKSYSIKTIENRLKAYKLMYDISLLNDIEFEFLDILLPEKLTYWFNSHIFKAIHLSNEEIINLLKKYRILFEKTHKPKTGNVNFFTELFNDIRQDNFNEAIIKINEKRCLNADNDYSIISPASEDKSFENHRNSFTKKVRKLTHKNITSPLRKIRNFRK